MKAAIVLFATLCLTAVSAIPPPPPGGIFGGGAGASPFMPSMVQSFIPTPEELAALNALHTTPAPVAGVIPGAPAAGPTAPPTVPPAVATLVSKYMKAATSFMPPGGATA